MKRELIINDFSLESYMQFLEAKKQPMHRVEGRKITIEEVHGFDAERELSLSGHLFDYQKFIVTLSLARKRFAVFADVGLGKTAIFLEWVRHIQDRIAPKKVLIISQLHLIRQTIDEQVKFYGKSEIIDINAIHKGSIEEFLKWHGRIGIVNLDKFKNPQNINHDVGAVVLDECFPPETPIEVFNLDNSLSLRHIKDIRTGDKILNAQGVDYVTEIHKRRINRAIQINVGGRKITCSENHPFFTLYGWKCAQDLQPGDSIMATRAAMRLVRSHLSSQKCTTENAKILRDILLSEMEDGATWSEGEDPQSECCKENIFKNFSLVSIWNGDCEAKRGTNPDTKSDEQSRNKDEGVIEVAEDEAQTFRAWGQWSRDDIATANHDGCIIRELDCGIFYITRKTSGRFSNMLQGRLGNAREENSNRNRWGVSLLKKKIGPEERFQTEFARVDRVAVLEPGCPELEKYRDADGHIYFYDIKAKRHPSFSVNGLLVHNSSCLKNETGKIRTNIIDSCKGIPYKLACSATPAPNDRQEYANHALFLDYIDNFKQFFTKYFYNTGSGNDFELKPHAKMDFYKFLSTWSIFLKNPSKYGFNDNLHDLQPAEVIWDRIDLTPAQHEASLMHASAGQMNMFGTNAGGITNRNKISQIAKGFIYL